MDKTSFNVKIFEWDYLNLTARTKETYFRRRLQKQNKQGISTSFICFEKRTKHKRILSSKSVSQKEYSHKQSRIVSNSLLALLHMTNLYYSLWDSARPKPGFGIGNRNQDQVSVSVSGPELFLPKPKLYTPSTLNIDLLLWHTQFIVCEVKC